MSKSLLKRLHSNYNVRVTCFLILVIKGCMLSKENKVLKQWWVNEWEKSSILCKLFHFILFLIILYNYHKSFREYNSCPGRKILFCSFAQFCLNLWPHGLLHTWLPCASLSPGICSNSCPLSRWYHTNISSSDSPFSSCFQSFPASQSFPMNWLFTSGGQSIEASASVLMNTQDWSPLGWTGLISLQYNSKASVLWRSAFFMVQLSHPYMTTG